MPDGEELSGVGRTTGARNEVVAGLMKEAVGSGKCPFCSPYFEEKNGQWVIELPGYVFRFWKVWRNPSPLPGTSHHIMLAPTRHVLFASGLEPIELAQRNVVVRALQEKFGYESFSEFSRQGKPDYNSATVYHLHYHIVVSSGEPASAVEIPTEYAQLIGSILNRLRGFPGDELESLDKLREYMDVFREAERGKAIPIRAKFSNKVGPNRAT